MTDPRQTLAAADQAIIDADAVLDQAEWVTVKRYALIYGIDRGTVYKWLRAGILDTYRVGTLRRIRNRPPEEKSA